MEYFLVPKGSNVWNSNIKTFNAVLFGGMEDNKPIKLQYYKILNIFIDDKYKLTKTCVF